MMGDQIKRVTFEFHPFGNADGAEARDDRFVGDTAEVEALATRMNGFGDLLRIGGRQDEHHMLRRFLKRFQQRVERRDRQHVNLVDDVDLVSSARRGELHAADDLLADVFHTGTARGVELVNVGMGSLGDHGAILAGSVRIGSGALFAQERLGKQAGRGRLARAARSAEQVSMADFVLLDGVFDGALDLLLPHNVLEDLRTVFAIQRLCHMPHAP